MRVGIVLKWMTMSGGTQRAALEFARLLLREGHAVTFYTTACDRSHCFPALINEMPVVSLGRSGPAPRQKRQRLAVRSGVMTLLAYAAARVERGVASLALARRIDPSTDVLVGFDNSVSEVLWLARKRHNLATAWVCVDLPPSFRVGIATRAGAVRGRSVARLLESPERWAERWLAQQCSMLIVHATKNRELVRLLLRRDAQLIFPGVNTQQFHPRPKAPLGGRTLAVACVSSFAPYRRFEDLITAVRTLNDWGCDCRLTLAGDESLDLGYASSLHQLVETLELQSVVLFRGTLDEKELLELYQNADVFVWPNHNQSWGLAVVEAMACGTPVVVSRTAGVSEILTNRVNALIVDPLDPLAIAGALRELAADNDLRSTMAKMGLVRARELSWASHAGEMLNLVNALQSRRNDELASGLGRTHIGSGRP
jgi:glycosyltransferase involved in cell wall biosynthesis